MSGNAKSLFKAIRSTPAADARQGALIDALPDQAAPVRVQDVRDPLDYDPTPPDATRAFLAAEGARMAAIGGPVWENAVGGGHIARVLADEGFDVIGSDIVDRGWPGTRIAPIESWTRAPAAIAVTNPPYNKINGGKSGGYWLRQTLDLGVRYAAFLLNWDWPAATSNGLGDLLEARPFSRVYLCRWKIDFRGLGSPPNRNGWFVWDLDGEDPAGKRMLFLDRADNRQGGFLP